MADLPAGCRFHPRCDFAEARCRTGNPLPEPATATHATACIRWREVTLGASVNGLRVVRSGLAPGERIVVNGVQRVRPGALLAPQAVAMDAKPELHAERNGAPRS